MVSYLCHFCNYQTHIKCNYDKHLKTQKHLKKVSHTDKNVEKCGKNVEKCGQIVDQSIKSITEQNQNELILLEKSPPNICKFCSKKFSRSDSLKRHVSVCKLNLAPKCSQMLPNAPKFQTPPKSINEPYICSHCGLQCSKKFNLVRHQKKCSQLLPKEQNQLESVLEDLKSHKQLLAQKEVERQLHQKDLENQLLKKDLEKEKALNQLKDKTIEIARQGRQTINNKTINFLNAKFGDMITMEQFLYNLQHHEQLTYQERDSLLASFKEKGMELFARNFSYIMKQNCQRQLLKEGLPPHQLLPLYCSDGNLRSHKEKETEGWKTSYDNQSINRMINISSTQVYESHRQPIPIVGRDRNKIFKQIKQDNHANNEELQKLMDNSED